MWICASIGLAELVLSDWTSPWRQCPEFFTERSTVVKAVFGFWFEWLLPECTSFFSVWEMGKVSYPYKEIPISLGPSHLSWMKSALLCILPRATNRCILQLHTPSCLHLDPFVWRRCYSKVGTPAEFKWGSPEWSNADRLAGGSSFHGHTLECAMSALRCACLLWLKYSRVWLVAPYEIWNCASHTIVMWSYLFGC